jgi:putative transposase
MRIARIVESGAAYYHIMSRVVDRRMVFDDGEKERFRKTLKQRISFSYNRRHNRKGTLWEERYKSILVEGSPGTLMRMAAYIDLNAVRAGIVKDPKDYRFSGYGEAMGGSKSAREGLMGVVKEGDTEEDWATASARYRQLLYVSGERQGVRENGMAVSQGFSTERVDAVMEAKGKLPMSEVLRIRVRYFTDGVIIGSRLFVEESFGRHRGHFSAKREAGAKAMKGGDWGDMFTARQLRVDIFGTPASA